MMRRRVIAGLIALCITGGAGAAKADETANAKKAIQAIYAKVEAAAKKKDAKGLTAHLAPDYEEMSLDGIAFKAATVKMRMERVMQSMTSMTLATTITKITVAGDKATVATKSIANMTGVNPRNEKTVKLVVEKTSEEQWEKKGGAWLEKRSKTLTLKQTTDGKEVPAAKKFKRS